MTHPSADRGHAVRDHTADAVIEAWGPTAASCYEEAAVAFVELFADVEGATGERTQQVTVGPGRPEELLVLLVEELVVALDTSGRVPVAVEVEVRGDRLDGRITTVPASQVEQVGPAPKGVSWSGLEMGPVDGGWWARATIDV